MLPQDASRLWSGHSHLCVNVRFGQLPKVARPDNNRVDAAFLRCRRRRSPGFAVLPLPRTMLTVCVQFPISGDNYPYQRP